VHPFRTTHRSFDAVVRERMVTIAREAQRETGFARTESSAVPPVALVQSGAHLEWRERQARQQRYEALVCEQLGAMWIDEVPRLHEKIRRR
jgi:hypothetical protein